MRHYPWDTNRRFNAYSDYFKSTFGERIQKISIDAGFSCPNRDGTCGVGGCTFCDNAGFTPFYNHPGKPVEQQINEGIEFHRKRYRRVSRFLAYFQAYSNTYDSIDRLKEIYEPALKHPGIIGIVVGTRPDCVDDEKLDYFAHLSKSRYVVVEYGVESVFDRTLKRINRGHAFAKSVWAIQETAKRGVRTGCHMIIGLPGEDMIDWLTSVEILSKLPISSIKFHQLQIIKGTQMAIEYQQRPEDFFEMEMHKYLNLMVDLLERLNPEFVVERIAGEINPGMNIREGWGLRYDEVLRRFEEIMEVRDTWQGRLYKV